MTRRRGKDRSLPSYNGTTATQRTVVLTLPEEMWQLLDEARLESGHSMREVVSATIVLALEGTVAERKAKEAA